MLTISRWWDLGVVAAAMLVAGLAAASTDTTPWATWIAMGILAVAHLTFGRRAIRAEGTPLAYAYAVLLVAVAGLACLGSPLAAMIQMVTYPLLWMLCPRISVAIGWNVAMAVAVALGSVGNAGVASGLVTAGLSLAMSVVIGLWITEVAEYGQDRNRLLEELRASQAEVAELERQAGRDAERARVAREIHDTIAQSLTGLVMVAQRAQREVDPGATGEAESLAIITELATSALGEARALVTGYGDAGAGGLTAALSRVVASFRRETEVDVVLLDERAGAAPLSREQEVVLLRCAQESLANVRKHAHASHAVVRLAQTPAAVTLEVADDGVGPGTTRSAPGEGTGVAGMTQRVALAGGTFAVGPGESGGGTLVRVALPVAQR